MLAIVYNEDMSIMAEKSEAFCRNVRELMKLKGTSQSELARQTKLSRAWLSEMLNGKANPSLLTCEKIARALGTSLEGLIAEPLRPTKG